MEMALSHIKVLDLTSNLSGPYCAMLLADQGADVIKIERPDVGDDMRVTPPFVGDQSAPFMIWNRNKRSMILDLKSPEGLENFKRLAMDADVIIENYKPTLAFSRVFERLQLHCLRSIRFDLHLLTGELKVQLSLQIQDVRCLPHRHPSNALKGSLYHLMPHQHRS